MKNSRVTMDTVRHRYNSDSVHATYHHLSLPLQYYSGQHTAAIHTFRASARQERKFRVASTRKLPKLRQAVLFIRETHIKLKEPSFKYVSIYPSLASRIILFRSFFLDSHLSVLLVLAVILRPL